MKSLFLPFELPNILSVPVRNCWIWDIVSSQPAVLLVSDGYLNSEKEASLDRIILILNSAVILRGVTDSGFDEGWKVI